MMLFHRMRALAGCLIPVLLPGLASGGSGYAAAPAGPGVEAPDQGAPADPMPPIKTVTSDHAGKKLSDGSLKRLQRLEPEYQCDGLVSSTRLVDLSDMAPGRR